MTNHVLINQNSKVPTEKMKIVILVGKAVPILFGLVAIFYPEAFDRIPAGFEMAVGGFITSLLTDIAGYFKKEKV